MTAPLPLNPSIGQLVGSVVRSVGKRFCAASTNAMPATHQTHATKGADELQAEPHSHRGLADTTTVIFRRDGDYWTLSRHGRTAHLKNSRGLERISKLLHSPGRQFHALELAAESVAPTTALGDAGPAIDGQARDAYRARLLELREREAEALTLGDCSTVEKTRLEIDALSQELARSLGLHGYGRRTSSPAERARVNVTRTIRLAISKLAKVDEELGSMLSSSIRTGRFCLMNPRPGFASSGSSEPDVR